MRPAAALVLVLAFAACGGGSGGTDRGPADLAVTDATADAPDALPDTATADARADTPTAADAADAADVPDAPAADTAPDTAAPSNHPPVFGAFAPVTLDMGTSTTVDLQGVLGDDEDPLAMLDLSWSARHVAVSVQPDHRLYVVAPTTWFGEEDVAITATDTGGLSATSTLAVTVNEVQAPPPPPPVECGTVTFSYDAGPGTHVVLLSGTFNQWASTAGAADAMTDPDGDGTYSVDRVLDPGVYQYKFIVDGTWMADPANSNQAPDGYGAVNSVVQVPACPDDPAAAQGVR